MWTGRPRLTPQHLDVAARDYVLRLSTRWRATGLEVSLVECLSPVGEPESYVLTARSAVAVLICKGCNWLRGPLWFRRRSVWTVSVSVRRLDRASDGLAVSAAPRLLGVAAAPEHELAWRTVLDWLDGKEAQLHADLEQALATV